MTREKSSDEAKVIIYTRLVRRALISDCIKAAL